MGKFKEVDAEVNLQLITSRLAQKPFVMFVICAAPRCIFVIGLLNR
jgi:hypothetical protein